MQRNLPAEAIEVWSPDGDVENCLPLNIAIKKVFESRNLPVLGGESGKGWSRMSSLQKCPRLYQLRYGKGVVRDDTADVPEALAVGSLFHILLALFYMSGINSEYRITPEVFHAAYEGPSAPMLTAWRIFQAYTLRYEDDALSPLVVEHWAHDRRLGFSCRFDLIAQLVEPPAPGLPAGTYIVEHKSAARLSADTELWFHDGEVIGQVLLYERLNLAKKFGPLQGSIVNVTSKEPNPKFQRIFVNVSPQRLKDAEEEIRAWNRQQKLYERRDYYPKARGSCFGRYGRCEQYYTCNS